RECAPVTCRTQHSRAVSDSNRMRTALVSCRADDDRPPPHNQRHREADVMLDTSLSRRRLLAGASATTAFGLLRAAPARAKAPMLNTPAPAFYRFKLGSIEATVVSDGPLAIGPASRTFRGPTAEEVGKMMSDHFLPADNVVLDQNVLVINTGDKL